MAALVLSALTSPHQFAHSAPSSPIAKMSSASQMRKVRQRACLQLQIVPQICRQCPCRLLLCDKNWLSWHLWGDNVLSDRQNLIFGRTHWNFIPDCWLLFAALDAIPRYTAILPTSECLLTHYYWSSTLCAALWCHTLECHTNIECNIDLQLRYLSGTPASLNVLSKWLLLGYPMNWYCLGRSLNRSKSNQLHEFAVHWEMTVLCLAVWCERGLSLQLK